MEAFGSQEVLQCCNMLRLIHMYLAAESGRSENEPFVIDDYFYDCFIRRAPVKHNTTSECIRTVATIYS